jgi:hypothetical protein
MAASDFQPLQSLTCFGCLNQFIEYGVCLGSHDLVAFNPIDVLLPLVLIVDNRWKTSVQLFYLTICLINDQKLNSRRHGAFKT